MSDVDTNRMSRFCVRGLHDVFWVPGKVKNDKVAIRLKMLYPAGNETSYITRPDYARGPLPIVVFLGDAFTESNRYQWLGEKLVEELGVAFVTYEALTGINGIAAMFPYLEEKLNLRSATPLLVSLFDKLQEMNTVGLLKGVLDLERIVLGGHSVGGIVALLNGNREFFPNVVGVFSYASHLVASPGRSNPRRAIVPARGKVPVLMMGGSNDGIVRNAEYLCREECHGLDPIRRTFHEALCKERPGYFVEFNGFNYSAIVYPVDNTIGAGFKDLEATVKKTAMKHELSKVISLFVRWHAFEDINAGEELDKHLTKRSAFVRHYERKL